MDREQNWLKFIFEGLFATFVRLFFTHTLCNHILNWTLTLHITTSISITFISTTSPPPLLSNHHPFPQKSTCTTSPPPPPQHLCHRAPHLFRLSPFSSYAFGGWRNFSAGKFFGLRIFFIAPFYYFVVFWFFVSFKPCFPASLFRHFFIPSWPSPAYTARTHGGEIFTSLLFSFQNIFFHRRLS